jgi:hypothetical protein
MAIKGESELKKYLTKKATHELTFKFWQYRGNKFTQDSVYQMNEFYAHVTFYCDLRELKVMIDRGFECNGTYEVIAEKTFDSENATADCIEWVVETLMKVYKILKERTAPYSDTMWQYNYYANLPIGGV